MSKAKFDVIDEYLRALPQSNASEPFATPPPRSGRSKKAKSASRDVEIDLTRWPTRLPKGIIDFDRPAARLWDPTMKPHEELIADIWNWELPDRLRSGRLRSKSCLAAPPKTDAKQGIQLVYVVTLDPDTNAVTKTETFVRQG
jgi:hypothetical protein